MTLRRVLRTNQERVLWKNVQSNCVMMLQAGQTTKMQQTFWFDHVSSFHGKGYSRVKLLLTDLKEVSIDKVLYLEHRGETARENDIWGVLVLDSLLNKTPSYMGLLAAACSAMSFVLVLLDKDK